MDYKYISADNHLDLRWVPRDLWQDRVAARFRDNAPKVVETPEGSLWAWEGRTKHGRDGGAADGPDNAKLLGEFFSAPGFAVAPGALPPADPDIVLRHMDIAGIYAGVAYGSVYKWDIEDAALLREVYRVYADWVMELSRPAPDRLIFLPPVPTALPEVCPGEIYRLAGKGAKAIEFSTFDAARPVYDEIWEPTWAAAAETGLPLCCHIGGRAGTPYPPTERGNRLAFFAVVPLVVAEPVAQLVFCGAFERHPGLRFSFAECRIGWVPFLIHWMDRQVRERPGLAVETGLRLAPSDYIRRQVTFTFEEDEIGTLLLGHPESYLQECVMWGADYPHPQGVWTDPDPVIDRLFAGIDPAVRHDVLFERARKLFRIEGPGG